MCVGARVRLRFLESPADGVDDDLVGEALELQHPPLDPPSHPRHVPAAAAHQSPRRAAWVRATVGLSVLGIGFEEGLGLG